MLIERKEILEKDNVVGYIDCTYKSSNILKTTYFPKIKRLYISFSRGSTYSYSNISNELYEEFENAESHGKFFHQKINKKDKHPFRREFTLYPTEIDEIKENIENSLDENNEE